MRLFPHNKEAYIAAVKDLNKYKKTCIIHPTGTGKSILIAKFIEDNPKKKHLLLAPSYHIYLEIKKHTSQEFVFSSYPNLITNWADYSGYDYIYADEFHRIGADVWGQSFQKLLSINPNHKLLGLSATHIRFLDDYRDMAQEVFDNKIASHITLPDAIDRGILKKPIYVLGVFDYKKAIRELRFQANKLKNKERREQVLKKIKTSYISWEKSKGIEGIIKKHLIDRNKIIAFCSNKKHLEAIREVVAPVLKSISMDFELFQITSHNSPTQNLISLNKFSESKKACLFTIDKFNEGLHCEGVDTALLFRNTVSPIIFFQQIGRTFSVKQQNPPLILDFVNNANHLTEAPVRIASFDEQGNVFTDKSSGEWINKIPVEFKDETFDFSAIRNSILDANLAWNDMFIEAALFYKEHRHLKIPATMPILRQWVDLQKRLKRTNQLSAERIAQLESISIQWERPKDEHYKKMLLDFYNDHHRLPRSRSENQKLYDYISRLKMKYKNGLLTTDEVISLKPFFDLEKSMADDWEEKYAIAKEIYNRTGELLIKRKDPDLGTWVTTNRIYYRTASLSEDRIRKLKAINFPFNVNKYTFQKKHAALVEFYKRHKRLPTRSENPEVFFFVQLIKRKIATGLIDPEVQKVIESIPIINADRMDIMINEKIDIVRKWVSKHGDLKKTFYPENNEIRNALIYLRNRYKKSELPGPIADELIRLGAIK